MWASGYHMWCNFGAHMGNEGLNPVTILFPLSAQIISWPVSRLILKSIKVKKYKNNLSFKLIFYFS